MHIRDKTERAAIFYVLNRSSFSGTTFSGGMSPGHPRFNAAAIERVKNFKASNIRIEMKDFRESIAYIKMIFCISIRPMQMDKLFTDREETPIRTLTMGRSLNF